MPETSELERARFDTIRKRLVKIGVRIVESATVIHIAFASVCPNKALFGAVPTAILGRTDAFAQPPRTATRKPLAQALERPTAELRAPLSVNPERIAVTISMIS